MRAPRGLAALTIAALAIGSLSLPASAAGATRWVDADGKAGPAGCAGSGSAKTTIQAAVTAASAGDTVVVCPGDYPENVVVGAAKDGLTIRGATQWTARIRGGDGPYGGGSSLLRIASGASGVTVRGLVFVWDAGRAFSSAGFGSCTLDAAIWVQGQDATILANRVRGKGITFSPCGYVEGIRVGEPLGIAGPSLPASADVSHNAVRDFVVDGIVVNGAGVTATVQRNSVRFWHLTSGRTAATRLQRSATGARLGTSRWPGVSPAGPGFVTIGIAVGPGATGEVYGNEVSSGPDAEVLPAGQVLTPALDHGISAADATGVILRGNTVRRARTGLSFFGVTNGLIRGNVTVDHSTGIELGSAFDTSDDNRVAANQVGPGMVGIIIDATNTAGTNPQNQNNRVLNNTVFGHLDIDCVDETSGAATFGTANTWSGNSGATSSPLGLCGGFQ